MDVFAFCYECPEEQEYEHTMKGLIAGVNNEPIVNTQLKIDDQQELIVIDGEFDTKINQAGEHTLSLTAENYEPQSIDFEIPEEVKSSELSITLTKVTQNNKDYQIMTITSDELNLNVSDTIPVGAILVNQNNQTNGNDTTSTSNTSTTTANVYSEKFFFDYNVKEMNAKGNSYEQLISTIISRSKEGKVKITIESSASKVPTSTYGSNNKLASVRGNETKDLLIKSIKTKANMDNIIFEKITTKVSGPDYAGDYQNADKYKKYQYVNIVVQ